MRYPIALLPTALLAVLSIGIPGQAIALSRSSGIIGAAYLMTNDPSGNDIIIHSIAANGTVSYAGFAATGGKGVHAQGSTTPDAFFSQSPLVVSGQHMFTVNAASNTVTMFAINPSDPTKLQMVGQPVNSGGDFPDSIAIHPKTGYVYVLNSGTNNGVHYFKADPVCGLEPLGHLYPLHISQTTPPTGPPNTPSHVLFTKDGSKLRVSVKGNTSVPGFLGTWAVNPDGSLSSSFTTAMPPSLSDGPAQYGMVNVVGAKDAVLVSDAVIGATVYDFSTPQTRFLPTPIPGQLATCWVQYSSKTGTYWLSDTFANKLYEMSVNLQTLKATLINTIDLGANNEPLEITVATIGGNDYLYVLTPSDASINVLALKPNEQSTVIQDYQFGDLAMAAGLTFNMNNMEGMGIYIIAN